MRIRDMLDTRLAHIELIDFALYIDLYYNLLDLVLIEVYNQLLYVSLTIYKAYNKIPSPWTF